MAIAKTTKKQTKGKKTTASKAAPAKAGSKTIRSPRTGSTQSAEATGKRRAIRKDATKDPAGGLTAAGRAAFAKKEGSHLRPGVQGAADTPEKMKRKGSVLRRHFANPRGPMERDGKPTRLALSAHAWGEPVPKTMAAARKLAAKGTRLLDKYQKSKEGKKRSKS